MKASTELTEKIEEIGAGFEDFTKTAGKKISSLDDRLGMMEAQGDRPQMARGNAENRDQIEHKTRFVAWMREPHSHITKTQLSEAESEIYQQKVVTIGTPSAGGYAVPALVGDEIEKRVAIQNPFRQLVKVVQVGTSSYSEIVSKNAAGTEWVGETGTRSETATSELIQCNPTWGTLSAYPKASEESVSDIFFDVAAWLIEEVADGFAGAEAVAIWSGNGSNKPSGLKNTTPTSEADGSSPERAATALQYLPITATSSPFTTNGFGMDDLVALAYSLKDQYITSGEPAWVMRRSTGAAIRKLKDDNGQYHWQPSTILGQPDSLLGFPVYFSDAVDANDVVDGFPVAFGNFRRSYLFAIRNDFKITIDDNISTPGYMKFYVRRRVGGQVLNHEAVRLLKYALS